MVFPGSGAPPDAPVAADAPAKKGGWAATQWREASGPKKAMMVLMVPLLWAVWVIFTDKPAQPRPAAKPPTSAAVSASVTSSASAPPPVEPAPEPPPVAPVQPSGKASAAPASSAKTPQREAADAVAGGAYDKAARLYEELARAHPEVPAYAEAARIMKAKAGRR
jgi:hypothetical protein